LFQGADDFDDAEFLFFEENDDDFDDGVGLAAFNLI
jgi:hypothetical protein